jgi:hypothetical protein
MAWVMHMEWITRIYRCEMIAYLIGGRIVTIAIQQYFRKRKVAERLLPYLVDILARQVDFTRIWFLNKQNYQLPSTKHKHEKQSCRAKRMSLHLVDLK